MSLLNILRFITSHPLTREAQGSAIKRFLHWQLSSRVRKGDMVYPWIGTTQFLVRRNETGLTGNIYTGLHEFADMAFVLHCLRPSDLFVDVGANVGSYTLLACSVVGARGIAIEPVPGTYERLVANCRLNQLDERVQTLNAAVGERAGTVAFTTDADTMNHVIAGHDEAPHAISVKLLRLDDLLQQQAPLLIKIDVEGFETAVIQGATNTLAHPSLCAIIMEINDEASRYGYDASSLIATMKRCGFSQYTYAPFERELSPLDDRNVPSGNGLFIRDVDFVQERLKTAPTISVLGTQL